MHQVAPLVPDMQMVGRAFTLRYIPAREDLDEVPMDNLKDVQRIGIEQVTTGDVFVIDARGDTRRWDYGVHLSGAPASARLRGGSSPTEPTATRRLLSHRDCPPTPRP